MAASIISSRADEFEEMVAEDEFLEYADVFGNYYGTARRFLEGRSESGNDLLLDIDVQGAAQVKQRIPDGGKHLHSASEPARNWRSGCAPRSQGLRKR